MHRYVVGNIIGSGLSASFLPNVVTLETDAPYTLANNFIHGSASPNAKPAVKKKKPKEVYLQVTLVDCIISSWSLRVPGGGQVPWLEDSVSMFEPAFTCLLHNNHIVGTLPFIGNALNFPQLYNVVSPSLGGMDPVTGSPTTGSMAIDAGDPSTAFLDLDLTRNDAGCTGGSWAIFCAASFRSSSYIDGRISSARRFGSCGSGVADGSGAAASFMRVTLRQTAHECNFRELHFPRGEE